MNNFKIQGNKPNEIPTWKKIQQAAQRQEANRRAQYGENVPDKKAKIDAESAEKLESLKLFSDEDLAILAAEMEEIPRLQINRTEYVRILSGGALNTTY